MTTLCYKCSQRKAVVDAKLRARNGGVVRSDPQTKEFEAYLYHQNPLCDQCTILYRETSRGVVTSVGGNVRDGPRCKPNTCTLCMVAVALTIVTCVVLFTILYHTHYEGSLSTILPGSITVTLSTQLSRANSYLNDVIILSRDVITRSRDVISTCNVTALINEVHVGEVYYPRDFDGMIYTIVLAIQVTTIALRQYHKTSIAASILSYLIYTCKHAIPGVDYQMLAEVVRYFLLAVAILLVFTKKSTVVTVSQRKNTQKPVIKVRRSPKKRADSPLAVNSAFFSDDEDFKPANQSRMSELSSANLSRLFDSSADQSALFESNENSEPMPLKDVSSRFNIMKISGSPVKSPSHTKERTPHRSHVSCLKPAKFSLDRTPDKPAPLQETVSEEEEIGRLRLDTASSEDPSLIQDHPRVQQEYKPYDALPLKPIIVVLVLSVITNYYLLVHYVLVT